jgi:hypothetical protein
MTIRITCSQYVGPYLDTIDTEREFDWLSTIWSEDDWASQIPLFDVEFVVWADGLAGGMDTATGLDKLTALESVGLDGGGGVDEELIFGCVTDQMRRSDWFHENGADDDV